MSSKRDLGDLVVELHGEPAGAGLDVLVDDAVERTGSAPHRPGRAARSRWRRRSSRSRRPPAWRGRALARRRAALPCAAESRDRRVGQTPCGGRSRRARARKRAPGCMSRRPKSSSETRRSPVRRGRSPLVAIASEPSIEASPSVAVSRDSEIWSALLLSEADRLSAPGSCAGRHRPADPGCQGLHRWRLEARQAVRAIASPARSSVPS